MPGHLAPDHLAEGRYRLVKRLGGSGEASVWTAHDTTLDRAVVLRFFGHAADRAALAERAALAASLAHPRCVRIFDTGVDGGQFFTVSELLPGSLEWARLPLPGPEVVRLGVQVAEALAYAHQRGVTHGALHAGNVLLGEQGAKVADFGLSASAIAGHRASAAEDVVALGRLLVHAATGERDASPSSLPDDPKGLAGAVTECLAGVYTDPRQMITALRAAAPVGRSERSRSRRVLLLAGALLAAAAVAVSAIVLTRTPDRGGIPAGAAVPIAAVRDFDPQGDGRESPRTAPRAIDGNPQTFWMTERYRSSADFGGTKRGVGLVLDLAGARTISRAHILLTTPGCSVEIRRSPVLATNLEDWEVVAPSQPAGTEMVEDFDPRTARWWLVWVTKLTRNVPGTGRSWACAVSEVSLQGPRNLSGDTP